MNRIETRYTIKGLGLRALTELKEKRMKPIYM
jgi:hypothetical protein